MPNQTLDDRIMVAVAYCAAWYPPPPQPFKAPLSSQALLTARTGHQLQFIPDSQWDKLCQRWGLDESGEEGIFLPATPGSQPGMGVGDGWRGVDGEEWMSLNVTKVEDKIINLTPNLAAIG